jgi:hypothetical protein
MELGALSLSALQLAPVVRRESARSEPATGLR